MSIAKNTPGFDMSVVLISTKGQIVLPVTVRALVSQVRRVTNIAPPVTGL